MFHCRGALYTAGGREHPTALLQRAAVRGDVACKMESCLSRDGKAKVMGHSFTASEGGVCLSLLAGFGARSCGGIDQHAVVMLAW